MSRIIKHSVVAALCTLIFLNSFYVFSFGESSTENKDKSTNLLVSEDKVPYFDVLNREDGLSNLSVSSIIQDKNGFMWFGTQEGLNRYDGNNFEVISNDPFSENQLVHNLIQTMYYDEQEHELWIGTYQGVSRYNICTGKFTNFTMDNSNLSNPIIVAITMDDRRNIWIGTLDGLDMLDTATGQITVFPIPGDTVRALHMATDGNLYIGSLEGLLVFNFTNSLIGMVDVPLPSKSVMVIQENEPGELTLGLWDGGVVYLNLYTKRIRQVDLEDGRIYTLCKTIDETLWVGTWGDGLYAINADGTTYHYSGNSGKASLSHPVVYSLMQSDSGILWIGTNGGGINWVSPRKSNFILHANNYLDSNSLSLGKMNAMTRDYENRLWVAVYNQGINIFSDLEKYPLKIMHDPEKSASIPTNSVRVIQQFYGKILLGTDAGLGYFNLEKERYTPLGNFEKSKVYAIEAVDEQHIWIGTNSEGLFFYDLEENTSINYTTNNIQDCYISNDTIYDILLDSKGRLWVATNEGLNLLEKGNNKFQVYTRKFGDTKSLASNCISTLMEARNGKIWIGTIDGGVSSFNEETNDFTTYTTKDGIAGNTIESILEGEHNSIWLSTHNGITIIDLNSENPGMVILKPEDGIGGFEFSKGSLKENSFLYFSGFEGIVKIPESYTRPVFNAPKLYITDVELNNQSIDISKCLTRLIKPTKATEVTEANAVIESSAVIESIKPSEFMFNNEEILLDYTDAFISFKFEALAYENKSSIEYLYKLEGMDKDFINNGQSTSVNYGQLDPGTYKFLVYTLINGEKASQVEGVTIIIKKPWYKTFLAYGLYLMIILIFAFLFSRLYRSSIIKNKNIELARLNNELKKTNLKLENLSMTDGLTGCFNRRYYESHLFEQLELAIRNEHIYLTVIMVDVDNFKGINDDYGHLVGDRILQEISYAIKSSLPRSTDMVARYGGDEFVIVLYDTPISGARIVVGRMQEAVKKMKFIVNSGEGLPITLSIGCVSILPGKEVTPESLTEKADKCLYVAKDTGKNQAYFCEGGN